MRPIQPMPFCHIQPRFGEKSDLADDSEETIIKRVQTAADKNDFELVKKMADEGVDIKKHLSLSRQVTLGNVKVVGLLVQAGADLNGKDEQGFTILHNIVFGDPTPKNVEMFQLLVNGGAKTDIPPDYRWSGATVEYYAEGKFKAILRERDKVKQIPVLLAKNELGINGWELLHDVYLVHKNTKSFWDRDDGAWLRDLEKRFPKVPRNDLNSALAMLAKVNLLSSRSDPEYGLKWVMSKDALDLMTKYNGQELDKTDYYRDREKNT